MNKSIDDQNIITKTNNEAEIELDYQNTYVPRVHNIGQVSMALGIAMLLLPPVIMYYVFGWNDIPVEHYIGILSFQLAYGGTYYFTEHLRYYPLMGAAATYIGYFAGNAPLMRLPVAASCSTAFDEDILSARGQILATVGVAASVVANVVTLLLIVVFGKFILQIMPEPVISALNYMSVAIFGYLIVMTVAPLGQGKVGKGFAVGFPWIVLGIVCKFVFQDWLKDSNAMLWTILTALAIGMLIEYLKDKKENKA